MTLFDIALLSIAGFVAGSVNAVAGGGTFFSFPALLAVGVPPVIANASNAVALWPASLSSAWAYRKELRSQGRQVLVLCFISLIGGVAGGLLLLAVKENTFTTLIPWLLLFATLLFAFSKHFSAWLAGINRTSRLAANGKSVIVGIGYLIVAVYGGFFGAGMGILILAALSINGYEDVHEINAIKNLLSAVIYSVAVLTFVIADAVAWGHAWIVLVAATVGGYAGVLAARRIAAVWLRGGIIAVGLGLSAVYFFKVYAPG